MHRFPKSLISAIALIVMTGTAAAQDQPAGTGETGGEGAPAADPAAPAPAPAAAEGSNKGAKNIGIDVAGVLPLSDYGDAADFAIGGLGRFEFGLNEMLSITGRVGFLYHIGTPEGTSLFMVPILAGARYSFGTSGVFAFAELGLNYTRAKVEILGVSETDSQTNVAIGAGAGYQAGKIQARAGLLLPDVGEAGDAQGLMFSVGYNIAAL